MLTRTRHVVIGLVLAALAAASGGAAFVYSGAYDISAVDQHTKPVFWLIEFTMRRAVAVRAKETQVPDLTGAETISHGFALYHQNCEQCHGAPGVSPQHAVLGMMPAPANLVRTAREWTPAQMHWAVANGIKMTGMPAWKYRMNDEEMWAVVAFLTQKLPYLSAKAYAENIAAIDSKGTPDPDAVLVRARPNADAGARALMQYACPTCHEIPKVTGATQPVGPPLTGMASRSYIGGALPNTHDNMVRWLKSPPRVKPGTAMPDLGISDRDAGDIAAYLATLKSD